MSSVTNNPLLLFLLSLLGLSLAAWIGAFVAKRRPPLEGDALEEFDVIRTAALTLLALLIGFSFSMAVSRYEQRKTLEEAEANAIGTEYVRADLLPAADAAKVRSLLLSYLDQRVAFYTTTGAAQLHQLDTRTNRLEADLWAAVRAPALAQGTPVVWLVLAGMNDVLNSQGYTQAAWWNRIPIAAWALMMVIAIFCNVLVGFGATKLRARSILLLVLPLVASVSFFLIADMDSPRSGLVRVVPQNLLSLSQSLRAP